jgi:hypothetical protein
MTTERDPEKERQYQHEAQQIDLLFQRLAEARKEQATIFADEYQYKIANAIEREIESTGLCARECMRAMADSFDGAMGAIERAARAWEEAAPLK